MSDEKWRWVVGYEGLYMVSDSGRVMSVPRTSGLLGSKRSCSGTELKPQDNGKGYKFVPLTRDGETRLRTVHRVVAEAFIPNRHGKSEVNHIDGDKSNNSLSNLEWVTKEENMAHASDVLGVMDFNQRFTETQVIAIRSDKRSDSEVAREFGVSASTINAIRVGKTYKKFAGEKKKAWKLRQRKLSDEDVIAIRSSDKTGVELASEYGVARSTISKIKSRQRYKEVI